MTGQEILKTATELLGYTNANNNLQLTSRITGKSVAILNLIYSDLWRICNEGEFIPIKTVQDDILLPERALNDVMPYGVAGFIAQSEEDGAQQQVWMNMYNQKRASLSRKESIQDVLPRSYDI